MKAAKIVVFGLLAGLGISKLPYEYKLISFDYSAHEVPIAYQSFGNTIELDSKVKLNPPVPRRGGAYQMSYPIGNTKDFEVDIEFTI